MITTQTPTAATHTVRKPASPPITAPTKAPTLAPTAAPAAQRTRVLRQFRVVFGAVRQHFHQIEKQAGVGGALVAALGYIQARPGLRVTELAVAMDVHQSTASNLVRQLVQRGLVTTEKAEDDRRSVRLQLALAGLSVLAKVSGPQEGMLPRALGHLSDEALTHLEQGLTELLQQLPAGTEAPAARTPLADL